MEVLNKRADFIKKRVPELVTEGHSITKSILIIADQLFISERQVWRDYKFTDNRD